MAGTNQEVVLSGTRQWAPQTLDWVPGEAPSKAAITIREAGRFDTEFLRHQMGLELPDIELTFQDYARTCFLAVRNGRHAVGGVAARHNAGLNEIVSFYVSPDYPPTAAFPLRLLTLPTLELPEAPTEVWGEIHDWPFARMLQAIGFEAVEVDHDRGRTKYRRPPHFKW